MVAILLAFGILLLCITYSLGYRDNFFNNSLFWASIILISIPVLLLIIEHNVPESRKICVLFLFGLALFLPHLLGSPDRFIHYDEFIHQQYTQIIANSGVAIDVQSTLQFILPFPGLELLTVSLKTATGLSVFQSGSIIIGFLHSLLLVILYLFFKTISGSERIAALGAFTYVTVDMYVFFSSAFSYESLALTLLVLCLYILSKKLCTENVPKRNLSLILVLTFSTIVFTHHMTSYVLIFIISIMMLFAFAEKSVKFSELRFTFLLITILVFGWMIYVAVISVGYYSTFISTAFDQIINPLLASESALKLTSQPLFALPNYEMFIRRFLYIPLTLSLFLIGLFYLRRDKIASNFLIRTLSMVGLLYFLPRILVLVTAGQEFARFYVFLFIGTAFIIGYGIDRLLFSQNKKRNLSKLIKSSIILVLIIVLIGGVGIGIPSSYRQSGSSVPTTSGLETYTSDVFHAADWFMSVGGLYNRITTDSRTAVLFTNYAMQIAKRAGAQDVFYPLSVDSAVTEYLGANRIAYLIVDERISVLLPEVGYFFDSSEKELTNYIQPLPEECLSKFDQSNVFNKFYDNGNILMYK